jgi:uncharacterized coiled-coil protein SlyX
MKKLAVTLLAAVLASGAFAQASFPDIPANHWAGDAVDRIADLGIVIGFPDGTFRGNEAFTRYQAALVVSRLLDVLSENLDAALALSRADIESLRNAVQELSSDLSAQGVRLSSAESAIAGLSDEVSAQGERLSSAESAIAGLSDEVAATAARLDELEARLSEAGGVDPAVLRDLQNQIASQRVAIDTAQAQADAAAARADEAYSLANQANTQATQNAEQIAALNRLAQVLSERIDDLESALGEVGGPVAPSDNAALSDAIERNRSDIANLREFVILLNRNQVALRDRVAALEASDAEQSAAIAALEDRVTALEENPLGITGSISVSYFVGRVLGNPFDVDRVYGLNNERDMGASVFSSGAAELDGDSSSSSNYRTEVGEVAQDRHDIEQTSGTASATLSLTFSAGSTFDGAGSPNALNSFEAVLVIDIESQDFDTNGGNFGQPINLFRIDEFTTTFSPIGAAPLTFQFGTDVETGFTPYVVATDDPGFVATVADVDFLSFVDPTLTVVYTTPAQDTYLRGARLTLSPFEGVTLGGSFAQQAENAADKDDVLADNVTTTVWGVDGSVSLSVFDLGFEWANGSSTNPALTAESVLYATLDVDTAGAGIPILSSLGANYRSIGDQWTANGYNLGADDGGFPFAEDQTGFGVNASLALFILDLDAYFDSYGTTAGDSVTAFGVDASADLFAGFSLGGFFHQASVNGTVVDDVRTFIDGNETPVALAGADVERDDNFNTGFGVSLTHDGDAENALVHGLNLEASYSQLDADFSRTLLEVNADMDLTVSIVTVTPYVGYTMDNDSDTLSDDYTELRVGAGLSTEPLNVYTQPSLVGAVNYRTANYSDAQTFTATELQWSVGLVLNQFIFDHSTLTAKYGSWTGTNINNATNTRGAGDFATDISGGDVAGTGTQSTSGYEVIWNYFDLEFAYGVYQNDNNGVGSSAQAFSIAYTVDLQ